MWTPLLGNVTALGLRRISRVLTAGERFSVTASLFLWSVLRIVTDCENECLRGIACKVDHLVFRIPPSADFKCGGLTFLSDAHDASSPRALRISPYPTKQNPGPHSARGVNPPSYITIIGNREPEVEVTLIPASASFPALLNSNVLEATLCRQSTFSLRCVRRLGSLAGHSLR